MFHHLIPDPIAPIEALRGTATSALHCHMLDVLIEHQVAELQDLDIDRVMATMIPEPQFWYFGLGKPAHLDGQGPVRDHYLNNFQAGAGQAGFETVGTTVGDEAIVSEGYVVMTGRFATLMYPQLSNAVEHTRPFLARKRTCIVFPFEDRLLAGETVYFDGPWGVEDIVLIAPQD